ncbi:MAG: SDR family oxidoreductase [Acidimicrobiia bacterium]
MTKISGSHVLITGGSSGIGLATAVLAARAGARVSLVARDRRKLDDAAAQVGPGTATASADVTDAAAVVAAVATATEQHGPVDVLITSAGLAHPGYFTELDNAVFREQIDVDYFGTLHAVRAVVPTMVARRRGHLVLVSSTAGLVGVFGYSAYAPAKYAVRGLAETLRPELVHHGITVACVYPPDTLTPGFEAENALKPPETVKISEAIKPRDAEHVAKAVIKGIEKDRLVITADTQTAALARAAGLLGPYVRATMDRTVRKVRRAN